tara:strand:- start:845 stop:1006 length:162 start_codon:yes stop_codon:yes gene_type:complete
LLSITTFALSAEGLLDQAPNADQRADEQCHGHTSVPGSLGLEDGKGIEKSTQI